MSQVISHYRIISKIGAGGMGEVYLAQDTKLDRRVALKILPADVAENQDRMRRFVQEAKAASALNHPNIITIYEIEQIDSVHFIATEFIDGETLRERVRKPSLKLREVLDVAVQIASALSAAHTAGIVHRDIKPENIMLRTDGIVKVLDFGLAKLSERPPPESVDAEAATKALVQTEPGVVLGTIAYMSPEQARGLAVDARTDIFSLGVVIYELVAGQAPFGGATRSDLIVALLEREPPPLARFIAEAPAELERIVMKALAKDPDERFQTVRDLLIDLKRLKQKLDVDAEIERTSAPELRSGSGEAKRSQVSEIASTASRGAGHTVFEDSRSTSSAEYIVSGIKQHKLALAIALLVLVIGAVGLSLYLRARNTEVAIDSIAVLPFEDQNHDLDTEYLSDGVTESIINSLTQLPNLRVIARSSAFRYKGKQTDPITAANELGVRAVLTGRILQRGENLTVSAELIDARDKKQLWGERYERKVSDLLSVQRDIAQEITANLRLKLSGEEKERLTKHYTENPEAYQLYLKGRYFLNARTEESTGKAIEYFQQAIAKDPVYALAYSGLADSYSALVFPIEAVTPREAMPKAKEAAMKALAIDNALGEAHASLGYVKFYFDWDWPGAETEFKRALELNPAYAEGHHYYSHYLVAMGRDEESLTESRRCLELEPLNLLLNVHLGWHYLYTRQSDQAVKQLQKTLEMDANFAQTHRWLGLALEQQTRSADAIAELQKAITLVGGNTLTEAELAHAHAVSGKRDEAQKELARLKEIAQHKYVPAYQIAAIYAGLGEKDQAFAWLDKAYDERSDLLVNLKREQKFDVLRSDPRFSDLLRRVGLPQ
jgi:serine/threonine-protein kinase